MRDYAKYREDIKTTLLIHMQNTCESYINDENKEKIILWGNSEINHIEEMKLIYNSFPEDRKPNFITMEDILRYEKEMVLKKDDAFTLRLYELDNVVPITKNNKKQNGTYLWYKVESKNDFAILNRAYENKLAEPKRFPEIICIQLSSIGMMEYYASEMLQAEKIYWEQIGYELNFKPL